MQVITYAKKQDRKKFLDFIYELHKNSKYFVDTSLFNCADLLYNKTCFARMCCIEPIAVIESGQTLCQAMLIKHPNSEYLYAAYFDAVHSSQKAVDLLLEYSLKRAASMDAKSLIIGINGHVSLGTGILQNCFDEKISFDSLYHPEYYNGYFKKDGVIEHTLSSYRSGSLNTAAAKITKKDGFSTRKFNFKDFNNEIEIFENLTNQTLNSTPFYYPPRQGYFKELFGSFRLLLKDENIIFVQKDGKEIGYIFWHPDFNMHLLSGRKNSALTVYFKNRKDTKQRAKINAVAILPQFQHTAAAPVLAAALIKYTEGFKEFETTFVWDDNIQSTLLNSRNGFKPHRKYKVYELETVKKQ